MNQRVFLYLASILAGFGMANIPASSIITTEVANFFDIIGAITIIIFSLAVLYLGVLSLFGR